MPTRKLEELNLLDDFLFGTMVTYPVIGEKFVRELLQTIFDREFGNLTMVPQKVYYGSNADKHGARLDVYVEEETEEETDAAYDVEPDQNNGEEEVKALPRRVRFYHAKIDAQSLKSGTDYGTLKRVMVIMITSYDPFDRNRMIYTIRRKCVEEPDMPYDDGAETIFLYTKGKKGDLPEKLRQLLHYMEDSREENAVNESLRNLHQMVTKVKQDGEVVLEYMKIYEREAMLIKQGRKQGREEEQANTERERKRADEAEARAGEAEARAGVAEARADEQAKFAGQGKEIDKS